MSGGQGSDDTVDWRGIVLQNILSCDVCRSFTELSQSAHCAEMADVRSGQ